MYKYISHLFSPLQLLSSAIIISNYYSAYGFLTAEQIYSEICVHLTKKEKRKTFFLSCKGTMET